MAIKTEEGLLRIMASNKCIFSATIENAVEKDKNKLRFPNLAKFYGPLSLVFIYRRITRTSVLHGCELCIYSMFFNTLLAISVMRAINIDEDVRNVHVITCEQ